MEDLTEAGRDGAELGRLDAERQADSPYPLADHLPGEVDVGALVEGHGYLGQAKPRQRANLGEPGKTGDGLLHRSGELPLDLEWPEGGGHCVDLDLHRGRV